MVVCCLSIITTCPSTTEKCLRENKHMSERLESGGSEQKIHSNCDSLFSASAQCCYCHSDLDRPRWKLFPSSRLAMKTVWIGSVLVRRRFHSVNCAKHTDTQWWVWIMIIICFFTKRCVEACYSFTQIFFWTAFMWYIFFHSMSIALDIIIFTSNIFTIRSSSLSGVRCRTTKFHSRIPVLGFYQ